MLKRNKMKAGEKPASDGLPALTLNSQTTYNIFFIFAHFFSAKLYVCAHIHMWIAYIVCMCVFMCVCVCDVHVC